LFQGVVTLAVMNQLVFAMTCPLLMLLSLHSATADHLGHAQCSALCVSAESACLALCGVSVLLPPVFAMCCTGCVASAAACTIGCARSNRNCFDDNVTLRGVTSEQQVVRKIWDVKPGEMVLTLVNGNLEATEVLDNIRHEGEFDFIKFDATLLSGSNAELLVTSNHNMLVWRNHTMKVVQAQHIHVGDIMYQYQSGSVASAEVQIQKMQWLKRPHKNQLIVEQGTVFASDLWVTTVCDTDYSSFTDYTSALTEWRSTHGINTIV